MGLEDQSLISLTSLLLGLAITPLVRVVALRWNLVDRPEARKVHITPVPLLGGVAIYLAVVISLVVLVDGLFMPQLLAPLVGGSLISFVGLWDDHRALGPVVKTGVQVLVAAGVFVSGIQVVLFPWAWLNFAVTVVWILGITNAFNLMDNMDGLSGGVGAVASFFFLVFSLYSGQYIVGCIAAAILGACLGFLFFNYNPARIFMGDAGSLFLGFMLSLVGIKLSFPTLPMASSWMIPVLVLALPIFDTTLVTFSRIRRGTPIWVGGKDHMSHRLRLLGLTTRQAVTALYLLAVLASLAAAAILVLPQAGSYALGATILLLGAVMFWFLERIYYERRESATSPSSAADVTPPVRKSPAALARNVSDS